MQKYKITLNDHVYAKVPSIEDAMDYIHDGLRRNVDKITIEKINIEISERKNNNART